VIDPEDLLHYAARRINRTAISWAVIGGLAVSARTIPRFTQDLDLAVAVSDDREAEGLIHHLTASGFRLITLLEQTATGRLATVRLAITSDTSERAVVDLLFASSGIESEVVAAATQVSLTPSLRLPVATIGHLIALKVLSRNDDTRPQDVIDLRNLMVEAAPDDLRLAEESLALISARGYDRGKNLRAEYEQLLARFRPTS
jgi:predicted nucleotidyltransferase